MEKLYYESAYRKEFEGTVLSCEPGKNGFEIVLDQTAFYPEGGGQPADTGILGGVRVLDVHEKNGRIVHMTKEPLTPGETVWGKIDWDRRFLHMQEHSGEHLVSGLIHGRFGYDNVGFHMGAEEVTIDFNGRKVTYPEVNLVMWAGGNPFAHQPDTTKLARAWKKPDTVIVMNEPSLPKFEPLLKKGGLMIINSSLINSRPTRTDITVVCVPCNKIAQELGMDRIANLVALGAFIKQTGAVSLQSVEHAMKKVYKRAKPEMLELNKKALQAGYDAVK